MQDEDKTNKQLIEELKDLRHQLTELDSQNKALLKTVPDLMFIVSKDGIYVGYHASNPDLLLEPPESFLGKKVGDILPPALSLEIMRYIELAIDTGESQSLHSSLNLAGKEHRFENRITPIDNQQVIYRR